MACELAGAPPQYPMRKMSEPTKQELRDRIAELERRVAARDKTIEDMKKSSGLTQLAEAIKVSR